MNSSSRLLIRTQSECSASRQMGSYMRAVSTASSLAIGSTYLRGARYSSMNHVLLTFRFQVCIKTYSCRLDAHLTVKVSNFGLTRNVCESNIYTMESRGKALPVSSMEFTMQYVQFAITYSYSKHIRIEIMMTRETCSRGLLSGSGTGCTAL